jgi:hypothetical protein
MGDAMPEDNVRATDDTGNLPARFPRRGILLDPVTTRYQRGFLFDD